MDSSTITISPWVQGGVLQKILKIEYFNDKTKMSCYVCFITNFLFVNNLF
jgi:hypothetical protein